MLRNTPVDRVLRSWVDSRDSANAYDGSCRVASCTMIASSPTSDDLGDVQAGEPGPDHAVLAETVGARRPNRIGSPCAQRDQPLLGLARRP